MLLHRHAIGTVRSRRTLFSTAFVAASLLSIAGGSVAPTAAAAPVPLKTQLGFCQVKGGPMGAGTATVKLFGPSGKLQDSVTISLTPDTPWAACFPDAVVDAGERVDVVKNGKLRARLTTPRLLTRIDRVADTISGRAPAGDDISLQVMGCDGFAACPPVLVGAKVTANAQGRWSRTLLQHDLNGWDQVYVEWTDDLGNKVSTSSLVPWMRPRVGSASVSGVTLANAPVEVSLRTKQGVLLGVGRTTADSEGDYTAVIRSDGQPVKVREGHVLRSNIAGDAVMKVKLSAWNLPAPHHSVDGRCYSGQRVMVAVMGQNGVFASYDTADDTGFFHVTDVDADANAGSKASVRCITPNGDLLERVIRIQ